MSKMGQELERRLDENKYEMYEVCREIRDFLHYIPCHLADCSCGDRIALEQKLTKVLIKVEDK